MIYRDYQDLSLSALGLGMMRLPVLDGDENRIDEAAALEMVDLAMARGINYYDTAWGYHGGNSELIAGKALSRYPRESYYLASKFPGYDLSNFGKTVEIFEKQLEKCQTDYFDFYLFHNVCEMNIDAYLDPGYGTFDYLIEQKRSGRIRHLGFSCHGDLDVLRRFLDAYGEHMEFCQLQINWFDWEFQKAKEKYELVASRGIPVWVMEPLRGGKLASLGEDFLPRLRQLRPDESAAGWAFRFLQSLPDVKMILSGMSNMQQLEENLEIFDSDAPLSEAETDVLLGIAREMAERTAVPCTGCRYCTSYCPMELDIPRLLELYNEHVFTGGGFLAPMALGAMPEDKRPSSCIGCGACAAVCPQKIDIPAAMAEFTEALAKMPSWAEMCRQREEAARKLKEQKA